MQNVTYVSVKAFTKNKRHLNHNFAAPLAQNAFWKTHLILLQLSRGLMMEVQSQVFYL